MKFALIGVATNLLGLLIGLAIIAQTLVTGNITGAFASFYILLLWSFFALSGLGIIAAWLHSPKIGGIMVIIGSIFFVPIGIVGIIGGYKLRNEGATHSDKRQGFAFYRVKSSSPPTV